MNWLTIANLLYAESIYIAEVRVDLEYQVMHACCQACVADLYPLIATLQEHEAHYMAAALECRHLNDLEDMGPDLTLPSGEVV